MRDFSRPEFDTLVDTASYLLVNTKYLRETILKSARDHLAPGGNYTIQIPALDHYQNASLKVMVWNSTAMHYENFALSSLATLGIQQRNKKLYAEYKGLHFILAGNKLLIKNKTERGEQIFNLQGHEIHNSTHP